jgi:hypothetical protein
MYNSYLNKIYEELEFCKKSSFTGNIIFQVNFREGKIGNMNVEVKQSFKCGKEDENP